MDVENALIAPYFEVENIIKDLEDLLEEKNGIDPVLAEQKEKNNTGERLYLNILYYLEVVEIRVKELLNKLNGDQRGIKEMVYYLKNNLGDESVEKNLDGLEIYMGEFLYLTRERNNGSEHDHRYAYSRGRFTIGKDELTRFTSQIENYFETCDKKWARFEGAKLNNTSATKSDHVLGKDSDLDAWAYIAKIRFDADDLHPDPELSMLALLPDDDISIIKRNFVLTSHFPQITLYTIYRLVHYLQTPSQHQELGDVNSYELGLVANTLIDFLDIFNSDHYSVKKEFYQPEHVSSRICLEES
ncbi:hypothetical protein AX774_g3987 [Zancudomyces culisetae]|uniref:Uncharacterized protein n=1 Tax=Zancudomyces culisetae TaxID=1213189 RepID=A0A1R1PNR3_ZANCU|nr:hypothetical protein AX774_g3987 [Zancudomyces culisetae]|eukprot:OMH82522.1 hypothetical protein AX774_g3987 [Zancudomyces culisetae]